MKKPIALMVASLFILCAAAQKPAKNPVPVRMKQIPNQQVEKITKTEKKDAKKPHASNTKTISEIPVGSSVNVYGIYNPQQNMLSYNSELDVLGFTRRGGPTNGTGNQVFNDFSTDEGATWDTTGVIYNNSAFPARYPSGALYNPAGNTDLNNLYSISAGPAMDGNTGISATYVSWKKRSGVAKNYVLNHGNTLRQDRNHFQICDNGKFYLNGYAHLNDGSNYTKWVHTLVSGTLNAVTDTIDNLTTTTINPPFAKFGTDTVGSANYSAAVAFNKSGTVGYYVFIGVRGDVPNPETKTGLRPIVYKTTDGGTNWNIQPDFNFDTIQNIRNILPGVWQDTSSVRVLFDGIDDVAVDANDNLHILSYIYGQYTTNPDSAQWSWGFSTIQGIMYDTYMTSTGWNATMIGSQNTKDYISFSDGIDIKNRLQIGLSADGQNVFYSWADSDPNLTVENTLPDIYIAGRHIDSATVRSKTNITAGTSFEFMGRMHTMAPQIKQIGDIFHIYTIITKFDSNEDGFPVRYWYLTDVGYNMLNTGTNFPVHIINQPMIDQTVCLQNSANFQVNTETGTPPIAYQWQYLNGSTWNNVLNGTPTGAVYLNAATNTMSVSGINVMGSHQYRCFVSNCNGAYTDISDVSTLNVISSPADAAGAISGPTAVCQGQSFTCSVPEIGNTTSYVWTLPAGYTGSSSTNSINVICQPTATSGNISVKGTNNCGEGIPSLLSMVVNPQPETPTVTLTGIVLHSSATSGNQWYDQNGIISGATNQDYTYVGFGNYYVIVTNANGCVSNQSNHLNIADNILAYNPDSKIVNIYPNPSSDLLTIEIQGNSKELNFEIVNTMGQIIYGGTMLEKTTLKTSDFAQGIYLIKFKDGKSVRFMKSK